MHAFISDAGTLHPALSAAIATVAPVSLLAATHGLGILVRVPAELPNNAEIPDDARSLTQADDDTVAADVVPRQPGIEPRPEPAEPAPAVSSTPVPAAPVEDVRREVPASDVPFTSVRTVEPLDDVDRWILDEERVDDLYPVDAP
jgi:hypothetical protein